MAEGGFHGSNETRHRFVDISIIVALRLDQRDQRQIRSPLCHRLKGLSFVINAGCDPEAVDGIRQKQHLDPARAEALELRRTLKAAKDPSRWRSRSPFGCV